MADTSSAKWILPMEIQSGSWIGFFRPQHVVIHGDGIERKKGSFKEKTLFSTISSIERNGDSIQVFGISGDNFSFSTKDSSDVDEFLNKILEEDREWNKILKSTSSLEAFSDNLPKILSWAGKPYVAAVDLVQKTMFEHKLSDFHIEPGELDTRVTVRKNRDVVNLGSFPRKFHNGVLTRLKSIAGCQPHLSGIPQEGSWKSLGKGETEFRLSIFPSFNGDRCSIRCIAPVIFSDLSSLGWKKEDVELWRKTIEAGIGLFLIVGPVGSGKTTTLYATLMELAHLDLPTVRRIVTIEDPVEGRLSGICQSSLDRKTGMDLAQAFKHLLRQDPDVIALGEIRDRESLVEALQFGLSGHLVLSTFHAEDALGAKKRIQQMGVDQYLINPGLKGVLAVRLEKTSFETPNNQTQKGNNEGLVPSVQLNLFGDN